MNSPDSEAVSILDPGVVGYAASAPVGLGGDSRIGPGDFTERAALDHLPDTEGIEELTQERLRDRDSDWASQEILLCR